MAESVGEVVALRRFPVKSMQGERLASAHVGAGGLLGDRAFAVVDVGSGEVIRGKTPELGPHLLACRAWYADDPAPGQPLRGIIIELPDGTWVRSESGQADEVLSGYFGRAVRLVRAAPPGSSFVAGRREFYAVTALPRQIADSSLLDAMPVSVLTSSTLDQLTAARPGTRFDDRRFRMNVVVATTTPGFVENAWPGRRVAIGADVRLRVELPTPRCSLTTMAQADLPRDPAVLRTVARLNSLEVAGRRYACAGVYAAVEAVGLVRLGDPVLVPALREESA